MNFHPTVIIGAGPTGLSAAYHLGKHALLIEQNPTVGGWCRSIEQDGFIFDYAGHIMFSKDSYVHEMYKLLLKDNLHWQNREAWIYSNGVYTRYPFQSALYGLPQDVIVDCILGAVEAYCDRQEDLALQQISNAPQGNSDETNAASPNVLRPFQYEANNFEEFIYRVWGRGIAKHFAIPYNRKLWAVPLDGIETSWLGDRVPLPDLREIIEGALAPQSKHLGPNSRFGYPIHGGFQALMDGFLPHLQGELLLNHRVTSVDPMHQEVTLDKGRKIRYGSLISTMPLPQLVQLIGESVPNHIRSAAEGLRHTSVRCVNIGIGRARVTNKHWVYYPGDTVFHRIFMQGNASPYCSPPGGFGITCEITYGPNKRLPCDGDDLVNLCVSDCVRVGLMNSSDSVWVANQVDMPYAYVIPDHSRLNLVNTIRNWLDGFHILLAGRYAEWEYYNSDHAFLSGKRAANISRSHNSIS